MVPRAEPRSYYGRPVIKEPVWNPEIPFYFFCGGMAGAASTLALGSELAGNDALAARAWQIAFAGMAVSPPLLIADLGRPERFHKMLRVFKPTSPMSMGVWILSVFGASVPLVIAHRMTRRLTTLDRLGKLGAGVSGPLLSTYTGVLLADTSVPAWHEARRELPFVFAGSSAASAGAAATLLTAPRAAGPARRLAVAGVALEELAVHAMERRLGDLGEPYRQGPAGVLAKGAKASSVAGAAVLAAAGRRRPAALAGAALVLAGSLLERWSVFRAGFQSARDPRYTVAPQRARTS
jgi:formate-dependent nitrite reductase membrane component NrfD